jgi:peptidoglycan/LPS O-acetylase OafA/YrhL
MPVNPASTFVRNNFDLIRIITALLVLVNHSLGHLELPIPGWYTVVQQFQRVPMFFVMSGFLLSASFERNSELKQYFTNRLTRIYPALWMCLLLTVILFSLVGVSFLNAQAAPWLAAQGIGLIYTPSFLDHFGYGSYNGSLWTIVIELQFYLCLPVIYWLYRKYKRDSFFYLLFALSCLVSFVVYRYSSGLSGSHAWIGKLLRYSILPHAYIFLAGILLQRWKVYEWKWVRGKALLWMALFLALSYILPVTTFTKMIAMIVLACCTISLAYSAPGIATKLLKNRDLSYGVYLYHGMLLSVLVEFELIGNVWYFIAVAVFTLVLAWLSYRYVEQPAMSWAKRKNAAAKEAKLKRVTPSIMPVQQTA